MGSPIHPTAQLILLPPYVDHILPFSTHAAGALTMHERTATPPITFCRGLSIHTYPT